MAQLSIGKESIDQNNEQRYQIFKGQHLNETMYEFVADGKFQGYLTACMRRFSPGPLGFTDEKYFKVALSSQWTYGDFDLIMQVMTATSPEHMDMTLEDYKAYREYIMSIGKALIAAREELEPSIRMAYEAIESVVDRSVPITAEA